MKERTNPKSVAPRKVKGTVLFTVVCVMMVLIVFLMGTLALATTANKRANANFQKEQTETIARTVLDSVTQALNDDEVNKGTDPLRKKVEGVTASGLSFKVDVDGREYPVTIKKSGVTRSLYDKTTDMWFTGDLYEMSTTVTTLAGNAESTYSVYLFKGKTPTKSGGGGGGGGAFVSLGDIGGKIGTSGNVTGGTQVGLENTDDNKDYETENQTITQSPFFVKGNLKIKSQTTSYFTSFGDEFQKQYVAVTGNLRLENNFTFASVEDLKTKWEYDTDDGHGGTIHHTKREREDIPTLYVGKVFQYGQSDVKFGDDKFPINIYCGKIEPWGSAPSNFEIRGNLYCYDAGATSKIDMGAHPVLLKNWGDSALEYAGKGSVTNFGNLYSAGSMEIKTSVCKITDGDLRVAGDLTIVVDNGGEKTIEIGGDLVCGGNLSISSSDGKTMTVKCKRFYGTAPSGITIDAATKGAASAYTNIYPAGCTKADIESNIVKAPSTTEYEDAEKYPSTLEELSTDNFVKFLDSSNKVPTSMVKTSEVGSINSSTKFENVTFTKNLYIDATAGPLVVIFKKTSFQDGKSIIVNNRKSDGTQNDVYFFMEDGTALEMCGGSVVTIDWAEKITGTTITAANAGTVSLKKGDFSVASGTKVERYGDTWAFPHLYIYGANGSKMTLGNEGIVTANIRAPKMNYVSNKSMKSNAALPYDEMNGTVQDFNGKYVGLVGQLIVHNASVANEWGMLYVSKDLPGSGGSSHGSGSKGGADVFAGMYYSYY